MTKRYLVGIGFGSDVNGLADQAAPCGKSCKPVSYPFKQIDGDLMFGQLRRNKDKLYNINKDGMAHYGLMPGHVEGFKVNGQKDAIDILFNSAEAYLQMRERVESHQSSTPPTVYKQLYLPYVGRCLGAQSATSGAAIIAQNCDKSSLLQSWYHDAKGLIHLQNSNNMCLALEQEALKKGNLLKLQTCDIKVASRSFSPLRDDSLHRLRFKAEIEYCVRAKYDNTLEVTACHLGARERFSWREQQGFDVVQLRNKLLYGQNKGAYCLDSAISAQPKYDAATAKLTKCDARGKASYWHYEATTGLMHSQINPSYCLDTQGRYETASRILVKRCTPGINQQWHWQKSDNSTIRLIASIAPRRALQVDNSKRHNAQMSEVIGKDRDKHVKSQWTPLQPDK